MKHSLRALLIASLVLAAACHGKVDFGHDDDDDKAKATAVAEAAKAPGVDLDADAQRRLGITTVELAAIDYTPRRDALGIVLDPQPLFVAVAGRDAARAAALASARSADRLAKLLADDGNATRAEVDAAAAQSAQDAVKVAQAERELASAWGTTLVAQFDAKRLDDLASQRWLLLRIESGESDAIAPPHATWLGADGRPRVQIERLWPAPAWNPTRPGGAWLALVEAPGGLAVGAHGRVELETASKAESGVLLPLAAVVYADGHAYAYVQHGDAHFDRRRVDTRRALPLGWFADADFRAGERVIVSGGGLALSAELGHAGDED